MADVAAFISAGGAGMLALVITYLLRSNRQDREQYEKAIANAEARADAAEQRTEVERQRARDAREVADEARKARYACEEAAAKLRAELAERNARDGKR